MTSSPQVTQQRDLSLEALRGVAALSVMTWHFLLAFYPGSVEANSLLSSTPLFGFVHGTGVISIFFVLSGFVLTRRYFETGRSSILIKGALKRWFRLLPLTLLSVMISWTLFHFHLYDYQDAAKSSGSQWLGSFAEGMNPPFVPTFGGALVQGLFTTYFLGDSWFNPLLWTIHVELFGSYLAFAFAPLAAGLREHKIILALAALITAIMAHFIDPFIVPFIPGLLLALYLKDLPRLRLLPALSLIALGIVFLGFRHSTGFYGFLSFLAPYENDTLINYISLAGAILIMTAFLACPELKSALQTAFARWLGEISFPFYLIHVLLLCSVVSAVFAWAAQHYAYTAATIIAGAVLLGSTVLAASILAAFDIKWAGWLNAMFSRLKIPD